MATEKEKDKKPPREQVQRVSPEQIIKEVSNEKDFDAMMKEAISKAYEATALAQNTEADKKHPAEMLPLNQEIADEHEKYKRAIAAVSAEKGGSTAIEPPRPKMVLPQKAKQAPQKPASPAEISAATQEFETVEKGGAIQPQTPKDREIPVSIKSAMEVNAAKERKLSPSEEQRKIAIESGFTKAEQSAENLIRYIQFLDAQIGKDKEEFKPLYEAGIIKTGKELLSRCMETMKKTGKLSPEYLGYLRKATIALEKRYDSDWKMKDSWRFSNDPNRRGMEDLENLRLDYYAMLGADGVKMLATMLGNPSGLIIENEIKEGVGQLQNIDENRKVHVRDELAQLIDIWTQQIEIAKAAKNKEVEDQLNYAIKLAKTKSRPI